MMKLDLVGIESHPCSSKMSLQRFADAFSLQKSILRLKKVLLQPITVRFMHSSTYSQPSGLYFDCL